MRGNHPFLQGEYWPISIQIYCVTLLGHPWLVLTPVLCPKIVFLNGPFGAQKRTKNQTQQENYYPCLPSARTLWILQRAGCHPGRFSWGCQNRIWGGLKMECPKLPNFNRKKGLGALHFRHPYFETYPYVDHQSQDLIFPHHSHSSDKSFHFGWFPKSSKRTILHTVVKTCRCLFWGAILGNQRKWKDIGPSGCNMKRMPTCTAFWKFTSFPKQSSDGLSSFPYSSW